MAYYNSDPKWLRQLERAMPWLAIPRISIVLITLQVFGFFLINTDPMWAQRLALLPDNVLQQGEWWRLVTYLSMPLTTGVIWMVFACWFLYSMLDWLENEWGSFKTTLYLLVSIVLTIGFSLAFSYPVYSVRDFNSTLFLAVATLFPEQEISIMGIIPVKMKYMAYLTGAFILFQLFAGSWMDRLFMVMIYSNYLLFFGPALLSDLRDWKRRRDYKNRMR
jgi:membrane associated rhomboid family serine protease